jgi:lysylphosphatidylglycerol synthetase-like protein (DUF2156 family)
VRAIALPLFGAVGTLTLAHGLARRRRLAWWTTAALLALCLLVALRGHPVRVAGFAVLLALLVVRRADFRSAPDPRRLRVAARLGMGLLALATVWWGWTRLGRGDPPDHALSLLVEVGLLAMLALALAPAAAPEPGTPTQRAAVGSMANYADADSLAPFATRRDKSYVFSPGGRAAIGYRVVLGTALAGGDPVGLADEAGAAIEAFLDLCRRHGWRPAVLGASDQAVELWRRQGLRGLVVGDEAVLDVGTFSLETRRMRNVRQAVARTHRAGIEVTFGPPTPELELELRPVLDIWLAGRQMRGFSMNLDQLLSGGGGTATLIAAARNADGVPVAFARFALCADGQTLTLDVAPRRPDAPNGVVERIIVEAVAFARASGAREVSLNFAALRRVFESDAKLSRVAVGLAHITDPWIAIAPLYRFCAKFNPQWRQRSLMLPSWFGLAAVGTAAILTELRAATSSGDAKSSGDTLDSGAAQSVGMATNGPGPVRPGPMPSSRSDPAGRARRRVARLRRR